MQAARKQLDQAKRADSRREQDKAVEELENARAELEEILRQVREEEVERLLVQLEARVREMLRAERGVQAAADAGKIPVSLCGAMASDPMAAILLVGLGLRELSMESTSIGDIKETISRFDLATMERVAVEARIATVEKLLSRQSAVEKAAAKAKVTKRGRKPARIILDQLGSARRANDDGLRRETRDSILRGGFE
jgi:hypothetical protein